MSLFTPTDGTTYAAICAAANDERAHPEEAQLAHLGQALMTETLDVLSDTALEDDVGAIAEGLLGAFQSIALRLQRAHDRAADDVKRLTRDFDGSEVADSDLQAATRKSYASEAVLRAVEIIRDAASDTYTVATGEIWSPWKGSTKTHLSTAAQIDAREAVRAKQARQTALTHPGDQVVAFRGSPTADTAEDAGRIFDALNWARTTWPQMKLATTGAKGAEKLAMTWARQKGVDVILARADFNRYAKAAPFRANDDMIALEPVLVLTLANSLNVGRSADLHPFGPALNAGQKAQELGYRHMAIQPKRA
jgi:hypothetical protein